MSKEMESLDYVKEWYINNYGYNEDRYFEEALYYIKKTLINKDNRIDYLEALVEMYKEKNNENNTN